MRRFRISPFTLVWVALIVILILRPIFGGIFT